MDTPYCNCDEMVIHHGNGKVQYLPGPDMPGARHSCTEVRRRNAFLPRAVVIASNLAGDPGPQFSTRFTRELSIAMDQLCAGIDPRAEKLLKRLSEEAA